VPIALALDEVQGGSDHAAALDAAARSLAEPASLPSARVLAAMRDAHGGSHVAFVDACSQRAREALLRDPLPADAQARYERMARESLDEQRSIEAAESLSFDDFRRDYLSPHRLTP
jgi:glutamate--cysteine ligase